MSLTTQAIAFFNELPFVPPLFSTPMGDAMVHLAPQRDGRVIIKWLASISRGSGRAALTTIVEAADRHKIGLELTARPQRPAGSGKQMTPEELETFFAGFGFLFTGRDEGGFAFMMRVPTP